MAWKPPATSLSVLLLPGQSPSVVELAAVSDTWSVSFDDSTPADVGKSTQITQADDDTWTVAFTDSAIASVYDFVTELGVLLVPWGQRGQQSDKSAPGSLPRNVGDTWSVEWIESNVDTVQVETADAWRVGFNDGAVIDRGQDYPAFDTWAVHWEEVTTLEVTGGSVDITPNDIWGVRFEPESAIAVAQSTDVVDTWSVSFDDSSLLETAGAWDVTDTWSVSLDEAASDVIKTPIAVDVSDIWAIGTSFEAASVMNVPTIPIQSSDEWFVAFDDRSGVLVENIKPPPHRRIRPPRGRRIIKPSL